MNEFLIELNESRNIPQSHLTSMGDVSNRPSRVCGYFDMSYGVGTLILRDEVRGE